MQVKKKTNGSFLVELTEAEKTQRSADLIKMHLEAAEKELSITIAADSLKAQKDALKSLQARMGGVAKVIHSGRETQFIEGAEVTVDTSTWTEVVSHPKDGRILRERLIPSEERDAYRQQHLFAEESQEAAEEKKPRARKLKAVETGVLHVANSDEEEAAEAAARG